MCGRFTIMLMADEIQEQLDLGSVPADWRPRFNVAPTQPVGVVASAENRAVEWMRWGLIPSWAKNMEIGSHLINARSETVMEKPSFRAAFQRRRCFLLADGFYEWQKFPGEKTPSQPFHFHRKDRKVFGLAGLWEIWRDPQGSDIRSCTILTTQANGIVSPVHDRMPVILSGEAMWQWISAGRPEEHLALLRPYPDELMEAFPVGRMVNDPARDISDCVKAV
jgi:putative SOS response-associated peptidase YedK